MPRLLPLDALDGPPVRARWTAVLAVTLAMTASVTDWSAAWDTARGLVPARTERHEWHADDLAAAPAADPDAGYREGIVHPEIARTAQLRADDLILDLIWDAPITIATIRVETYTDAFGTGHRLALGMETTTAAGTGCLNAALRTSGTNAGDATKLQYCTRTDLHEPPGEPTGEWRPFHFFLTQTANLDAAAYYDPLIDDAPDPTLVDYFGFGFETGDAYDTGLWPNWRSPQWYRDPECASDPGIYLSLDDLHLTDRYADPTMHGTGAELTHLGSPAYPVEDRLVLPACTPVGNGYFDDATALEPYLDITLVPLSSWTEFNASTTEPRPLRTAVAIDVRSCDTEPRTCSSDPTVPDDPNHPGNSGTAGDWLSEILHPEP
ncbi:hypothetical protein O1R50_11295 [Glycomyces luteolus]|uniref:Uncharacterized protein n=1 Tax=Glycomyces luteolus TaxID=2670330 RepID=A0A9X3PKF5_9ACTN|nr:hypothetical protein [Glycomyces luteolus]MDA1360215.1 hypothetical protein [Glycomyces luteolus]